MKKFLPLIAVFLFAACEPQKGRLRIKGTYENLPQADLLIYSPDGGLSTIDTLHVVKGKFTYEIPVDDSPEPYTWVILYPNFSTLSFMARGGSDVRIKGDALSLGNERVEGADSVITPAPKQGRHPLTVGKPLPKSKIIKQPRGQWLLISFWANWKHGSSTVNYYTRQALQQYPDSLHAFTYSLDIDPRNNKTTESIEDTVRWKTYCDNRGWAGPLVSKYGIRNIPYLILVDPRGRVAAMGTDYNRDIKPALQRIGNP
ncbi:MAG: DUF4369 domain-containing protein [Bacteroidaceae bacterium]|nr:DUF4369 domain-containing protein [Bacteroidaceae bacterium]